VSADRLACHLCCLLEVLISEPADVESRSLGTAVKTLRVCGAAAQIFGIDRVSIRNHVHIANLDCGNVIMNVCLRFGAGVRVERSLHGTLNQLPVE
jgi:hypothetical protein